MDSALFESPTARAFLLLASGQLLVLSSNVMYSYLQPCCTSSGNANEYHAIFLPSPFWFWLMGHKFKRISQPERAIAKFYFKVEFPPGI